MASNFFMSIFYKRNLICAIYVDVYFSWSGLYELLMTHKKLILDTRIKCHAQVPRVFLALLRIVSRRNHVLHYRILTEMLSTDLTTLISTVASW